MMDRGVTGNFEVTIVERDNLLIHSKRRGGQGKATTAKEREAIVAQVREALEGV